MGFINRLAFAAGLAAASGMANAQASDCSSAFYDYSMCGSDSACAAAVIANHPACFGGNSTTSQIQINGTAFQLISSVSNALASRFFTPTGAGPRADAGMKGMAAGGAGKSWNAWGSVAGNDTRQRYANTAGQAIRNDSDVLATTVGVDYALSSTMVFGVSAAFDRGDGSSENITGGGGSIAMASEGYSIAPYLGMQLGKDLALDASIGFGSGELTSGGTTTSEADRLFYAANLSYNQWMGNIQILGKLGYLHGEEAYGNSKTGATTNAGTAATNKIDQLRLGVQAGYWMNGAMPYAGLSYSSDVRRSSTQFGATDPIGKDAFVWTLGVNFFSLSSGVTGGIAYNQEENRSNQKNNSLMANINLRF
ncbi:MAG: autotransporter outer membrane beta-barrel domain-containing protein [Candidatus Nitricoxidivorans perseverans]|uniref:Autotransporter outer membrane beta-barrel domain-containing protein n=1 Tax=Candidatus Nitricoxidivorans perseverans TaxID=2975601 RepID=A0AA49FJN9_9PROT|nr:MAG: autotransporter outer membrane beta-barrel domain-containing protein [Candidatus Nitricoxidivorans perseverans]